jgi:hypothetical protein
MREIVCSVSTDRGQSVIITMLGRATFVRTVGAIPAASYRLACWSAPAALQPVPATDDGADGERHKGPVDLGAEVEGITPSWVVFPCSMRS